MSGNKRKSKRKQEALTITHTDGTSNNMSNHEFLSTFGLENSSLDEIKQLAATVNSNADRPVTRAEAEATLNSTFRREFALAFQKQFGDEFTVTYRRGDGDSRSFNVSKENIVEFTEFLSELHMTLRKHDLMDSGLGLAMQIDNAEGKSTTLSIHESYDVFKKLGTLVYQKIDANSSIEGFSEGEDNSVAVHFTDGVTKLVSKKDAECKKKQCFDRLLQENPSAFQDKEVKRKHDEFKAVIQSLNKKEARKKAVDKRDIGKLYDKLLSHEAGVAAEGTDEAEQNEEPSAKKQKKRNWKCMACGLEGLSESDYQLHCETCKPMKEMCEDNKALSPERKKYFGSPHSRPKKTIEWEQSVSPKRKRANNKGKKKKK